MGRNLFADDTLQPTSKPSIARQGRNLFAKEEPEESFFDKLPRNVGIGLANLGHTALNSPHDLTQGLEKQFQQFGNTLNKVSPLEKFGMNQPSSKFSLSEHIPYQQDYNFAQMLGQKGEPTWADSIVQKGTEYAPEFLMSANALRNVVPHLTKRGATKKLNQAKQTFEDWAETKSHETKGNLNVNPELIEDARQYLPNNLSDRHLLNEAANDYDKLFNLQSQVGKVSAKRVGKLTSIFAPETRIKGEAGLEARRKLINAMHENLQSEGLHNTSNLFREGQNDFRRYMKFRPYRNAIALAGLGAVGNEVFPQNPLTDLVKKLMFHAAKS